MHLLLELLEVLGDEVNLDFTTSGKGRGLPCILTVSDVGAEDADALEWMLDWRDRTDTKISTLKTVKKMDAFKVEVPGRPTA